MATEVSRMLEEMQTGQHIPTEEEVAQNKELEKGLQQGTPAPGPMFQALRLPKNGGSMRNEVVSEEAARAGWGESRYDTGEFVPGMDLENKRALEQSSFAKIGNGVIKGGVTAATTAVNTTLGTVFGVGSALYELAADAEGDGRGFMDTIDAGVNNWLSQQMLKLQNWSEKQFPNYRTAEERTEQYQREWWKHIGTANFIGDSILKNFGFTVGAMGGGLAWTKLIGKGLTKGLANNIMKGAIAASEGDATASAGMARAAEALRRGTAVGVDANAVVNNIKTAAQSINKMQSKLQLYGSVIGAMGEGTVEGLMASQEFLDEYKNNLSQNYINNIQDLENNLAYRLKDTDMVRSVVGRDENGQLAYFYELNDKGNEYLESEKRKLAEDYNKNMDYAEQQGQRLASTTFLLNLPILTTSNLVQFGRMFSGGWNTARNAASGVTGGITLPSPMAEGKLPTIAADYASKMASKGAVAGKTILNSLKVAGSESFEEMAQGTVSSGAKTVAENKISEFNDGGYDLQSIDEVRRWFEGMAKGGGEYLGDVKNWQEGFIGALTGLFGIPGKRWNGGVAEAYRDATEEARTSIQAADRLNQLVNSEDFQNRWHGYIRHLKYDNEMQDAVEADDEYAWHTANDAQLINDVIAFADAGKLEDLNQVVESYGTITETDAQQLREVLGNAEDATDWTKNASDKEIVDKVKKQADIMTGTIKEYKDIYDAVTARAPMGSSPEFLKEQVFTAMQIKAFDRRFLTLFGETMNAIEPVLLALASVDEKGEVLPAEKSADKFKTLRDSYEQLFAGSLLPVRIPKPIQDLTDKQLDLLEELTAEEDPELNKKVKDMRKLSEDRKEFYMKLQTLQGEQGQQKFDESAATTEKVVDAAEIVKAKQDVKGLNTLDDVKKTYFSKNAKERAELLSSFELAEESSPAVKSFLALKKRYDDFVEYVGANPLSTEDSTVTPPMVSNMLSNLLRRARSEEELINLPDSVFGPKDQFDLENQSPFGPSSPTAFTSVKQLLRKAMDDFMQRSSSVATRETLNPTEVTPASTPASVATPTGRDASQPGSQEPAPEVSTEKPKEQKPAHNAETEEKPAAEVVSAKPTEEQLVADSASASTDNAPKEVEEEKVHVQGQKDKTAYYRTSVPEIESQEAAKARKAISNNNRGALVNVDLSDFVKSHPEYTDIWNALQQRGAFEAVATKVEVGDEIEFVVDPTFPLYNGNYQILVTTNKDGDRQVLTILSAQSSQYYGLSELRKAIDDEYQKFIKEHPNDLFVFSKKSRVWLKRPGLMDYDYSGKEEKGIVDIPSYSEDAPIVFINRNGEAVLIRGNDTSVLDQVSDYFSDAAYNRGDVDGVDRRGNLYYLVKVNNPGGKIYAPIRLNVEHFKPENKDADNTVFSQIRDILGKISDIVSETNEDNLEEQNKKLDAQLEELGKHLDIHKDFFELGNYDNVGVALRYSSAEEQGKMRRPDQISQDWLVDLVASLGRPAQIKQDTSGKIENINELINQGLITSNARMLRPKGADFYFNPWIAERSEFGPITPEQVEVEAQFTEKKEQEKAPVIESIEYYGFGDRDEFSAEVEMPIGRPDDVDAEPAESEEQEHENEINTLAQKKYAELSEAVKAQITKKGYSEEEYDEMADTLKAQVLRCISV